MEASMAPADNRGAGRWEPSLAAGELLAGRYRIVSFLGEGAMGEVYEADDLELGEPIAVKVLRPEIARDEQVLQRFKREIQLARKVTHPNVCRVYDMVLHSGEGDAGRRVLLTMELLRGETLAERLRREGRLTPAEALPIVRQIAAALTAAHAAGIVHRDLKSSNVFLVSSPLGLRSVVTDFGLAWSMAPSGDGADTLTATGELVGSPAYMAPEQVRGEEATPATDVYALGVVMYEMLTGELPFVGKSAFYTALLRLQEPPPSPRQRVPDLDPAWEAVILCCLQREPADRFRRARHVVRALGVTASEEDATTGYVPLRFSRRKSRPLSGRLLPVVILLLAATAGLSLWLALRGEAPSESLPPPSQPRAAVAVLPFDDLADEPRTAYLGASLFQMLPTELAAARGLRPIPVEEVDRAVKDLALPAAANLSAGTLSRLRNRLGADLVVTGAYVVTAGGRTRFDVVVQDARSGETVAALSESGTEEELLTALATIGKRLRERLGDRGLSPAEADALRASRPVDAEAARLYAEALARLRGFDAQGGRDLLRRAVAIEPDSPLLHAALTAAWSDLGYDGKAREAAKRALKLSAGLRREDRRRIEARQAETAREWEAATGIYRELTEYFPDDPEYGLRLVRVQTSAGKAREALATITDLRSRSWDAYTGARIDLAEALAAKALSDFDRQRRAAAAAEAKGRQAGALSLIAEAQLLRGEGEMSAGEVEKAAQAVAQAAEVYSRAGHPVGVARALNLKGVLLDRQGDQEGAARAYREALGIHLRLGNEFGAAAAVNNLGILALRQGRLDEAGRQFEQALQAFRKVGRRDAEANALSNLGLVSNLRGDLEGYESRLREVLAVYREIGDRGGEARTRLNLGLRQLDRGDLPSASRDLGDALRLYRELGDRSNTALALQQSGGVRFQAGDLAAAEKAFLESLEIRTALAEKSAQADSHLDLATLALERGDAKAAEERARKALDLFHGELPEKEAEARLLLALCRLKAGDPGAAAQLLEEARETVEPGGNQRLRLFAAIAEARVQAASGQARTAVRTARKAVQEAARDGFVPLGLEARLALGEAEILAGDAIAGSKTLQALEREARERGFILVARKATVALGAST